MKLLIMKFSPLPCYLITLRPKYSPQRSSPLQTQLFLDTIKTWRQKVILRNVTAASVNYVWNNTIAVMNDKGRCSHLCNTSYAYVSVATHT
jgi:hypothetical protein